MLKPSYFYGKSDKAIEYYQKLEDYLLNDIAKFLLESAKIGGKADRELFVLKQMGLKESEIIEKLADLTNQSKKEVKKVLEDSVMTSFSNDKQVLDKYFKGEFGVLDKPTIKDVLKAEWIKTKGELDNLTRTTMLQFQRDLISLLNEAEIRVASGNQSYTSAVCEVLDNYAKKGMVIDYPNGARKNIESAVRCCVVTSMNQTAGQVTNQYIAEGGIEYVLITAHAGARHDEKHPNSLESHDWWQGKAYKIRGSEEGYPNLLESTGYDIDPITGEGKVVNPLGLHGYNCRHSHQPWDKGLKNPWEDANGNPIIDPEESQELYEKQQKQRAMERGIRSTKRQLDMKQTEIDSVAETDVKEMLQSDYDRLAYKLRNQNQAYNDYCEANDLQKQSDRLKVIGFNKADSNRANGRATAYRNTLFRTDSDPIRKYIGSAEESHPNELKEILDDLKKNNVTIIRRKGNMSYQPLKEGEAGLVCVEPNASISAWMHEYKHYCDDRDDGFLGMKVITNIFKCKKREWDAFQVEIDFALKLGYNDVVKELKKERQKGMNRFNASSRKNQQNG